MPFQRLAHERNYVHCYSFIILRQGGGFITAQDVPGITWLQQFGTTYIDLSRGISTGENMYVVGNTDGVFPGQTGYDPIYNYMYDAYVAKYDATGQGGKLTISAQKIIDVINDLFLQRGEVTASGDLPGTVDFQATNYCSGSQ